MQKMNIKKLNNFTYKNLSNFYLPIESYFNATVDTGDHLACSFPIPFRATALKLIR